MATTSMQEPYVGRFWAKVNKSGPISSARPELGPCWLWTAAVSTNGYGQFRIGKKNTVASRYSYELAYGPIVGGLWVLHHCDNPPCVRPDHLYLGTHRDNTNDMVNRSRVAHGERTNTAKLTLAQVQEIRSLTYGIQNFRRGECKKIAEQYGVSPSQVKRIATGRDWREVL